MELWGVYQVKHGGTTGATDPDTYLLKGIFLTQENASEAADKLVRGHDYYKSRIQSIYIPDEAVAMMFKAAIENMENND